MFPQVADFGLAVKMEQQQSHVSNMLIGTPFYLAPEVQHGGRVTTSADVYR
jgi:serine/threonine protein kinase